MQINLNNTAGTFLPASPIFSNGSRMSPYLSPLPDQSFRKYSYNRDDFINFNLQPQIEDSQVQLLDNSEAQQYRMFDFSKQLNDNGLLQNNLYQNVFFQTHHEDVKEQKLESIQKTPQTLPIKQQSQIGQQNNEYSCHLQHDIINFQGDSRIQLLIQYLVQNIQKKQQEIISSGKHFYEGAPFLKDIFLIFLKKFKKSKKTKEEMTKYCMRRAFKFVADKMKRDRSHNRDIDTCMKIYFSKSQANKDFTIPFKKNSIEKTMNGNFLKRIFSSQCFVEDYRQFLVDLKELMIEDNIKKIKYLATLISQHLNRNQFKKIQNIKRLPWTKQTLDQTLTLGISLINYSEEDGQKQLNKRNRIK